MTLPPTLPVALVASFAFACGGSQTTPPLHVDLESMEAGLHEAHELEPIEQEARRQAILIEQCFTSHADMPMLENLAIPMVLTLDEAGEVEEVRTELPPDYQSVRDCIEDTSSGWGIQGLRADEVRINWLIVRF